ncbi:chymotrypsin-related [Holotrichia oblita]|uniref:Chymotrypsin-related n=1 Tax=Holotrichia oblita TaxID=644536 RepID=A0ACB9TIJ6_HOLOL|nr:chymotrypsin-related [Holotrichia oblita]
MRSILVVAVALILAQANGDLSQLKRRELDALVLTRLPITLQQANERIVGGSEAERNSIPYQVALLLTRSDGTFFCGGSLISRKFVLTAAHCVEDVTSAQVILGAHRFNENEEGQVRLQATKFHIHSGWNSLILINDIATIELDEEVELTDKIQLVKLPSRSDASNTFANEAGRVSGWGKDSDQASAVSPVLREVDVNIITKLFCNIRYLGVIQDSHVCSSGIGGIGSCSGDSGGPLVVGDTQVGVVSFGLGLGCEIGWPSVYSRVTYFLDWIAANSDVVIA